MRIDARVAVVFGGIDAAGEDDAVLIEADGMPPGRLGVAFRPGCTSVSPGIPAAGCGCCAPRGALAQALAEMFIARATGKIAFFRRVVAVAQSEPGRAAMVAALTEDPVCAARFRIA